MNKETENFVKELEVLKYNLGLKAKTFTQINPTVEKELIQHIKNLTEIIQRWKDIG